MNVLPKDLTSWSLEFLGIELTGKIFLMAFLILIAAFLANRLSNFIIRKAIDEKNGNLHATVTANKVASYIIYSFAALALLAVFGIPLSALGTALGLIGLGVSFALKDMIANFISGLMIMINRPFKIGDQITVEGETGIVKDIRIRATDVKTFDGRKIIVPNSTLYSGTVVNNTAYDSRRFEVAVGISYEDDIQKAKDLAEQTLKEAENVETDPEPDVLVQELGGSSVDLKLRGWTKPSRASMLNASSEVTQIVKEKYDEAGIDIPYPIRTVYMNEG